MVRELTDYLRNAFFASYERHFGHADKKGDIEIVSIRTSANGITRKPVIKRLPGSAGSVYDAVISRRDAWFDGVCMSVPVYEREKLPIDKVLLGPAIVEEDGSTTVISPGWSATRDETGNLRLKQTHKIRGE